MDGESSKKIMQDGCYSPVFAFNKNKLEENYMNELQIFENSEFGSVRTVDFNGKTYFVANDVAKALGYVETAKAIRTHCKGVSEMDIPTNGGIQKVKIIPEGDIYRLVIKSKLPEADKFERWIFDEVLPSIRKHGLYAVDELINNPELAIKAFTALKEEREKRLAAEQVIEEQRPLVDFANKVSDSSNLIDMGKMAKLLKDEHINIGRNRLFDWLRRKEILMRNNIPYQRYIDDGYFQVKESVYQTPYGTKTQQTTFVTGKGQIYITEKLRKEYKKEVI